jgi:hypothetical protein
MLVTQSNSNFLALYGAAGIQPIVRLLSSGRGGSGGDGHSGWWVVGARVWELVKVRVEWKLFAMTWRLLVRCCEL